MQFPDTIFALSSGRPPSGVAVIRVSGAQSTAILEQLAGKVPAPRVATFCQFRSFDGEIVDRGLALFFPAPASFTGEDCAELHVHGGRAVVEAIAAALLGIDRVRPAEAGEFTRRAFLNGKMDLVEAEALADLVSAETEAQRRFAVQSAGGAQSTLYAGWRKRILHARAMIEAELDFADEGDVPGSVSGEVWRDMAALVEEIERHVAAFHQAEIIRVGFSVVIAGAPNVGKSSLLNALARRDVAIVTDEPGTTRDLVHVALDLGGVKVILTDTAGLREGAGKVESIGIEKAKESLKQADLIVHLQDVSQAAADELPVMAAPALRVGSKADLAPEDRAAVFHHRVSVRSGEGLDGLLTEIARRAATAANVHAGGLVPARFRHVALLRDVLAALSDALDSGASLELKAEELRRASGAFGKIAGTMDVEELLGVIFSEFCIGK